MSKKEQLSQILKRVGGLEWRSDDLNKSPKPGPNEECACASYTSAPSSGDCGSKWCP